MVGIAAAALAVGLSARLAGTVDSLNYLLAARAAVDGRGLQDHAGRPYTQYSPLLPVLLMALSQVGMTMLSAARLISAASLGVVALVASRWTTRLTGSTWAGPLGGICAVLILPALMTRAVWSEPLFMALTVGAGCCLTVALQQRSRWWLVGAGTLLGVAALTRYSGLVLIVSALYVGVVWVGDRRARLLASALVVLPAVAIIAPWLARNVWLAGTKPLGRRPGATVSSGRVVLDAFEGVARWTVPPGTPLGVAIAVSAVVAVLLGWAIVVARRVQPATWWPPALVPFVLLVLYVIGTTQGAVATRVDSLADNRLLTPAYPFLAVGTVSMAWVALRARVERSPGPRARWAVQWGPSLLLGLLAVAAVGRYGASTRPRERLADESVRSPMLLAAAQIDHSQLISNSPLGVAWSTDRPVLDLPTDNDREPRLDQIDEAIAEPAEPSQRRTVLVLWNADDPDGSLRRALEASCRMDLIDDYPDGSLYDLESCGE